MLKLTTIYKTKLFIITRFSFCPKPAPILRLPSFSDFALAGGIFKFLQHQQIHTPTYIQYALLSSLKDNYNDIHHITSPTGSGKTLSYLLPLVNHFKQEEMEEGGVLTQAMRPRGMVITLNKELVLQARNVAKKISHFAKFKCQGLNIGRSLFDQKKTLQDGVDILVSTHKRLTGFLERKQLFLSNLDWIVIDEVDTFYQTGALEKILADFRELYMPSDARKGRYSRLILSGTTCPPKLRNFLSQNLHGNYIQLTDKNTHINLQNIKHQFVQCFQKDKHQLLRSLLFRQKQMKTLIFCNTVSSVNDLVYFCMQNGIKVVALHSQLNKNMRRINYERFRDSQENIMISSDLGARGLDFPGLDRVINYDFPTSTVDYLQRAGRTGRAGRSGLVITIYKNKDSEVIKELKGAGFDKPIKISNSAYGLRNREDIHKSKYVSKSKINKTN